jgi:hypothetical protein
MAPAIINIKSVRIIFTVFIPLKSVYFLYPSVRLPPVLVGVPGRIFHFSVDNLPGLPSVTSCGLPAPAAHSVIHPTNLMQLGILPLNLSYYVDKHDP